MYNTVEAVIVSGPCSFTVLSYSCWHMQRPVMQNAEFHFFRSIFCHKDFFYIHVSEQGTIRVIKKIIRLMKLIDEQDFFIHGLKTGSLIKLLRNNTKT